MLSGLPPVLVLTGGRPVLRMNARHAVSGYPVNRTFLHNLFTSQNTPVGCSRTFSALIVRKTLAIPITATYCQLFRRQVGILSCPVPHNHTRSGVRTAGRYRRRTRTVASVLAWLRTSTLATLPWSTTTDELYAMFQQYGAVTQAPGSDGPGNRSVRGARFVSKQAEAQAAIATL